MIAPASSLHDPASASVLANAVHWAEGTLLGTVATTLAVIAVAWIGMLMLTGRIPGRRGITTIVGCFVVFGASAIVSGLRSAVSHEVVEVAAVPESLPLVIPQFTAERNSDLYAGASLRRP